MATPCTPARRRVRAARRCWLLAPLLASLAPAWGQETPIDPASIASPPDATATQDRLGLRVELWRQQFDWRSQPLQEADHLWRGVLDFHREWQLAPGLRLGLSDRFEALHRPGDAPDDERNALRELFVSRDSGHGLHLEAGRINVRQGMATGYNPSDFLRAYAVISRTSQDPAALRENRLGTVMLRAQPLGDWGSAQVSLVPKLSESDSFSEARFGLGFERTNRREALLLRVAPRTGQRVVTDWQLYKRAGDSWQAAANVSTVATDALLVHAEWAGGRMDHAPSSPDAGPPSHHWANRFATGFTWTSPWRMTVTLEHWYAGHAYSRSEWDRWRFAQTPGALARLGAVRREAQERQEPLVQRTWFARLAWDQVMNVPELDAAALARVNAYDGSSFLQLDLAWHLNDATSVRLIASGTKGGSRSEYGAEPLRSGVAAYLQAYF